MTRSSHPARSHRLASMTKVVLTPVCALLILAGCTRGE